MWVKIFELTLERAQGTIKKMITPFVKKAFQEQEKSTSTSQAVKLITLQKTTELKSDNPTSSSQSLVIKKEVLLHSFPKKSNGREEKVLFISSGLIVSSLSFAVWAWRETKHNAKHKEIINSLEPLREEINNLKECVLEMKKQSIDMERQILVQRLVRERYPSWFTYVHTLSPDTKSITNNVEQGQSPDGG